eukprot:6218110-Prymnesium_polylepis.3
MLAAATTPRYDRTPFKAPGSATTSATATPSSAASSSTNARSGGGTLADVALAGAADAAGAAGVAARVKPHSKRNRRRWPSFSPASMAKIASWRERRLRAPPPPTKRRWNASARRPGRSVMRSGAHGRGRSGARGVKTAGTGRSVHERRHETALDARDGAVGGGAQCAVCATERGAQQNCAKS